MGLRDRIKGLLGRPASSGTSSTKSSGSGEIPTQVSADGYRAIARSAQVGEGKVGTFGLPDGTVVAILRQQGKLYGMDNACAHEDGPIGEGAVQGTRIRCPYHDWEYDFSSGACITAGDRCQTTWKIREQDGFLWVGPKIREGTGSRGGDHNDGMKVIKG